MTIYQRYGPTTGLNKPHGLFSYLNSRVGLRELLELVAVPEVIENNVVHTIEHGRIRVGTPTQGYRLRDGD